MILAYVVWGLAAIGLFAALRWLANYSTRGDTQNGAPTTSWSGWGVFRPARDSTVGAYARRIKEIMQARDTELDMLRKLPKTEERTVVIVGSEVQTESRTEQAP